VARRLLSFICLVLAALSAQVRPINAQDLHWLFVEAKLLPHDCEKPQDCVGHAVHLLRNYMALTPDQVLYLSQLIDQHSSIRALADGEHTVFDTSANNIDLVVALHGHSMAEKPPLLHKHPGVYFDRTKLDANEMSAGFADHLLERLAETGLKVLTEEELETTPGRPTLAMRVSAFRESAGCVTPYSVSLSISEETVLVRDPSKKMSGTIWSGSAKQNLSNSNHTIRHALEEAVAKLVDDYRQANVPPEPKAEDEVAEAQ